MTVLAAYAASLIPALGWTLAHFLWQGALVALILACILAVLSGRSPQPRYVATCAALFLMAILPLVTFTRIVAAEHNAANTVLISMPLSISVIGHGIATPPEHRVRGREKSGSTEHVRVAVEEDGNLVARCVLELLHHQPSASRR